MKFGDYLKCHYIFTVGQLKNATTQVVQKLRSRLTDAANIDLKYFLRVAAEIDTHVEVRQTVVSIQGMCRDKSFIAADTDVCDIWWIISPVDALDKPITNKQASDAQLMKAPALMTHDPSVSRISGFEHVPDMDPSRERVRGLTEDKTCAVASTRIDEIKWFLIPTSTMVAEFKPRPQKPIPLTASPMTLWQFEVQTHETIRELYLDRLNFNSSSMDMDILVVTLGYEDGVEPAVFLRHVELVKAQCPILEIYKFEYEVTGRFVEICDLPRERFCCRGCIVM